MGVPYSSLYHNTSEIESFKLEKETSHGILTSWPTILVTWDNGPEIETILSETYSFPVWYLFICDFAKTIKDPGNDKGKDLWQTYAFFRFTILPYGTVLSLTTSLLDSREKFNVKIKRTFSAFLLIYSEKRESFFLQRISK